MGVVQILHLKKELVSKPMNIILLWRWNVEMTWRSWRLLCSHQSRRILSWSGPGGAPGGRDDLQSGARTPWKMCICIWCSDPLNNVYFVFGAWTRWIMCTCIWCWTHWKMCIFIWFWTPWKMHIGIWCLDPWIMCVCTWCPLNILNLYFWCLSERMKYKSSNKEDKCTNSPTKNFKVKGVPKPHGWVAPMKMRLRKDETAGKTASTSL